ncbi:MAG: YdeI/OmpD-associated family protein [Candidatus Acidiferrales bacterium]
MFASGKRFLATIYKIWMLRYVDVPEDVGIALAMEYASSSAKKSRGKSALPKHIPVVATSNHRSTRTTLVPAGAGRYRLQVNSTLRKAARADVGEVIGISLKLDLATRELPVPPELEAALKSRPRLKKEFDRLTVAGRMQFLRWFSAKSPEVRKKRLARALEVLTERALNRKMNSRRR